MDENDKRILECAKKERSAINIARALNLTENVIYQKVSMLRGYGYLYGGLDNLLITDKGKEVIQKGSWHSASTSSLTSTQKLSEHSEGIDYAGFGIRLAASIIGGILVWVIFIILLIPVFMFANVIDENIMIVWIILVLGMIAFLHIYEVGKMGGTIGHRLLKLKVVDENMNAPIGLKKAFIREFVGGMVCAFTFYIGYLFIIFDKKKQGLHDKIARTYVICEK